MQNHHLERYIYIFISPKNQWFASKSRLVSKKKYPTKKKGASFMSRKHQGVPGHIGCQWPCWQHPQCLIAVLGSPTRISNGRRWLEEHPISKSPMGLLFLCKKGNLQVWGSLFGGSAHDLVQCFITMGDRNRPLWLRLTPFQIGRTSWLIHGGWSLTTC